MPILTANTHPVSQACIALPRSGRLVADLLIPESPELAPIGVGAAVSLAFEDGTRMQTTCLAAGSTGAWWTLRLVGGAGKLDKSVPKRFYQGIPASTVAGDILRDCGEAAGSLDLGDTLNYWVRLEQPAWQALGDLLKGFPDKTWRTTLEGKINIASEQWPDYAGLPDVLEADPKARRYLLELHPDLTPGLNLRALLVGQKTVLGHLERVVHHIGAQLRSEVFCG